VRSRDKFGFYGFSGVAREYLGGFSYDGHKAGRCVFLVSICKCYVCTSNVLNFCVLDVSSEVRLHGNVGLYREPLFRRSTKNGSFNEVMNGVFVDSYRAKDSD
jgi:hypothetical protein